MRHAIRALALLAVAVVAPFDAFAATLLFVDVPGIPGDSTFEATKDQIQGLSYDFGISPLKASKYGQAGVCAPGQSKPVFSEFCVKKFADVATPKLFVAAATATQFPLVTVGIYKLVQGSPEPVVRYRLSNAVISSMHAGGDTAADRPTEQVCFRFNRAEVTTTTQGEGGKPVSETAGFDACQSAPF